jgi:Histidine kinase-like ATPase domain
MIASHLALVLALSLIVVVLALLVMALAAVPVTVAVGSVALAFGAGYHFRCPAPKDRWPAAARRPAPRWATTPAPPLEFGGLRWTQAWQTVPPPGQIPAIREQAVAVLAEWEVCGEAAEPALLVVTELLTNALDYADAPIQITLELGQALVRVQVHDGGTEPPQPRVHGPGQVRGHGLEIVAALALRGLDPGPARKNGLGGRPHALAGQYRAPGGLPTFRCLFVSR